VRNLLSGNRDGEILERPAVRAPRVPFNGRISAHRTFAFGSLPLDTVKDIKNELGVTVNDVLVALSAGAVREWLIAHDALPDRPLVAQIPVSVRTEEQRGTYGNRVSVMIVPIPTDEADPRERVMRAHETLRGAKERHGATPARMLQDVSNFIPPALAMRASRVALQINAAGRPVGNLAISNVPGPRVPLYMGGALLEANYPISVVLDGAGLNITVLSYRDHIDIGIVGDRNQIPDGWPMIDAMRDGLAQLEAASKPKAKPRTPARKRTPAASRKPAANGKPSAGPRKR
jgi:WS/DGAT/MGAT family acyltransferase